MVLKQIFALRVLQLTKSMDQKGFAPILILGSIHIGYADNQVRAVEIFKGTDLQIAKEIIETFKLLSP